MLAAILSLIKSLPQILDLISRLEKSLGPNWSQHLIKIIENHALLVNAKTPEERDNALKSIATGWAPK